MANRRKEYRELKVGGFCNYNSKQAPMLRIQGHWLEELGFHIGDPILVKCEEGKLIITLDEIRVWAKEKEKAFWDAGMEELEKRFAEEKKVIYSQMVAEREMRYLQ